MSQKQVEQYHKSYSEKSNNPFKNYKRVMWDKRIRDVSSLYSRLIAIQFVFKYHCTYNHTLHY